MSEEMTPRIYRSRLNELPIELKMEIGEIPYQKGMLASHREEKLIELLDKYNIEYQKIGTGTNRCIIKYKGFAVKIALDNEGIADNKQEWAISDDLSPNVAYAHEISEGGNLLVASYAPAFTSLVEMGQYRTSIMRILSNWANRYLLGDVGFSKVNYANWGLSVEGKPVCIDYAYIFPASMHLFKCICGSESISPVNNFTSYKCNVCKKMYEDRDIRVKISQQERLKLFNNVDGIRLKKPLEEHMASIKYNKIDTNPDLPNPYETAMSVANAYGFSFENLYHR